MGQVIRWPRELNNRPKQAPANRTRRPTEHRVKYFRAAEIKLLRKAARDAAELARAKKNKTGIIEWMAIDLLTSSGVRAFECANLRVGDCLVGYGKKALFVREGKWGKSRTVQIPDGLRDHIKRFITWKGERREPCGEDDHLFVGKAGPWTRQAVQGVVKKFLRRLGLYEKGKSVHSLRHSYATELYRRERDLRAVQLQLGHASTSTTIIYADVLEEDLDRQIKNLWGGKS
jgi:integrase/recombinase XerD